jgi:carbon monoxide dehydrogenase subunit G
MPIDVTLATSVKAPRDVVARFTMDPRNDVAWIGGVQEAEVEGAEPFAVGCRVRRVASFLGKRIEYVNRVDELEPGARLVMRSVKGPFPMVVTYAFGDEPDGATAVTVRVQGEPGGVYRIGASLMELQVRRAIRDDLRTLKALVEGCRGRTGG